MAILGELFTSAEMSGSVYLTNNQRQALRTGDSVIPKSVAEVKAKAYADRTGRMIYIDGIGEVYPSHMPDPEPDPEIGDVTATGDDLTGTNLALTVGAQSSVTAAFSGDAEDVSFKWTIRSGTAVSIVGDSTNRTVTLQGDEEGMATIRCDLTSPSAADSPGELTLTATVTTAVKSASTKSTKKKA